MTTCRVCAEPFEKQRMGQIVCGLACARKVPVINRKAERETTRKRKEAVKPRSKWLQEAQGAFNAYIRARDADKPCVSCGRHHEGQWHAGHFYSTGARPELRFDEDNCHKQCQPCNTHLHGNLLRYRDELLRLIGSARFESLGGHHEPKKYTVEDLKAIIATYKAKLRELQP